MKGWLRRARAQAARAIVLLGRWVMLIATICALVLGGKFLSASVRTALSVTGGEAVLWWSFAAVTLGVCGFLLLEALRRVRQTRNH